MLEHLEHWNITVRVALYIFYAMLHLIIYTGIESILALAGVDLFNRKPEPRDPDIIHACSAKR